MVLVLAEMGIGWRWKWFSRPRQGTRMTVADYHTQFCDWKAEMITLSFPAEEADYIDGFIENLRCDIGLRVSKWRLSISSLSDAFSDAKWAESLIRIEGNLEEFRATMVFDEISSPSEDDCSSALANESPSEEMLVSEELIPLKQKVITVACPLFDEMPSQTPIDSEKVIEVAGAKQMGEMQGDESLEDAEELLDEMPKSAPTVLQSSSIQDAHMEVLLPPHPEAVVKLIQKVHAGMDNTVGVQLRNENEGSFPSKMEAVEVAYKVFDETPKSVSAGKGSNADVQLEIARHMLDGMPELTSAMQNRRIGVHGVVVLQIGALSYVNEAIEDGRCVHVIERDLSKQDRIVGELLQPGGYLKLIELGLQDCVKDIDVPSCFVGLVLENCQLPFANHGHVILADPSPVLFYQISNTEIRCLVDVPGQKVPSISNGDLAKYLGEIEVSSFNIPSMSKFEEEFLFVDIKNYEFDIDCWHNGVLMFIFDPGGRFSPKMGCDFIGLDGVKQDLDKMPSNSFVELWVGSGTILVGKSNFGPDLQSYVWKPGQYMTSYILEDKDIFKRVGKDIVLMDTVLEITVDSKALRKSSVRLLKQNMVKLIPLHALFIIDLDHLHTSVNIYITLEQLRNEVLVGIMELLKSEDLAQPVEDQVVNIRNEIWQLHPKFGNYPQATTVCPVKIIDTDQRIKVLKTTLVQQLSKMQAAGFREGSKLCVFEYLASFSVIEVDIQTFVWDPGLVWAPFRFSTLRTRCSFRGGICHDMTFYYNFNCIFEFTYLTFYDVIYLGSDISHVISYLRM